MKRTLLALFLIGIASACGGPDGGDDLPDGGFEAPDAGADAGADGGGEADGGTDGGSEDGGSGDGGSDGGTAPAACADRTGGALVTFDIVDETLTVWITNDAFIDEAALQLGEDVIPRVPNFNDLHEGTDCDPQWSWHPDPQDVNWADMTIELCDGVPSFVENELEYWLTTVDQYCPWDARVTAVDDRR